MWASTFVVGHIVILHRYSISSYVEGNQAMMTFSTQIISSLRLDGKRNDNTTACQKLERYKRAQQCHSNADEQREQPQRVEEDNKELKVHY